MQELYAYIVIPAGDEARLAVRAGRKISLKEMQGEVGGHIEAVGTNITVNSELENLMIIDEEGKLKGKPANMVATMCANADVIVGTALIFGVKGEEIVAFDIQTALNILHEVNKWL